MPNCIVKDCGNRSSCKSSRQEMLEETVKITFHRVPKDVNTRRLWLTNLGLEECFNRSNAVVCSLHFQNQDFDRTSLSRVRLRSNAIPYVQVPETIEQESNDKCTEFKYPILSTEDSSTSSLHLVLKQEPNEEFEEFHEPLYKTEIPESETNRDCPLQPLHTNDAEVQAKVSREDKSTSVSPERLFHTPEKDAIREHAARMKKQYQIELKLLKQKYKRSNAKAANLQTILDALREKDVTKGHLPDKDNVDCSRPARLTERHFIKKLPATIDNEHPTRRCKVCSEKGMAQTGEAICKETNYFCPECDVCLDLRCQIRTERQLISKYCIVKDLLGLSTRHVNHKSVDRV